MSVVEIFHVSANPCHRIDIASPCLCAGASHNSDREGVRSETRERGELSKPSPATDCSAPLPQCVPSPVRGCSLVAPVFRFQIPRKTQSLEWQSCILDILSIESQAGDSRFAYAGIYAHHRHLSRKQVVRHKSGVYLCKSLRGQNPNLRNLNGPTFEIREGWGSRVRECPPFAKNAKDRGAPGSSGFFVKGCSSQGWDLSMWKRRPRCSFPHVSAAAVALPTQAKTGARVGHRPRVQVNCRPRIVPCSCKRLGPVDSQQRGTRLFLKTRPPYTRHCSAGLAGGIQED
jgi:hypothetical protein